MKVSVRRSHEYIAHCLQHPPLDEGGGGLDDGPESFNEGHQILFAIGLKRRPLLPPPQFRLGRLEHLGRDLGHEGRS